MPSRSTESKPPPEAAVNAYRAATARLTGVESREMLGYPCVFANGHMFAGLHQAGMILRLPVLDRRKFLVTFNARLIGPTDGRDLREYALVPRELLGEGDELTLWLRRSLAYVLGLAPRGKSGVKIDRVEPAKD
jgi:TfoX/Sxy family transcriptional regulator of competence genes